MTAPHRDDAAIRITENGQATIHYLGAKLRRPHAPRKPETNYTWQSADFSTRRTVTIASTARDLRAQLRYEGQPQQLEDMLAAGMRGAAMEYFPSISNPSEVYPFDLVEHSDVSPDPSRWFERRYSVADVLLRRRDGGTWDGVLSGSLFYWLAGNSLPGLTFTRSGAVGPYVDEDGVIQAAAANIIRTDWLDTDDNDRHDTAALALSDARTNIVSTDDVSSWAKSGTPNVTGSIDDPAGGTGAYTVEDQDGLAAEDVHRVWPASTFTDGASASFTFVVRENTMPASGVQSLVVRDVTAGVRRLSLDISGWTDGEPSITPSAGTLLYIRYIGNGYWLVKGRSTALTAANTHWGRVFPGNASATGKIDLYRMNAFDNPVPPIGVLDASETLNDETFYADWTWARRMIAEWGGVTFYTKFIERGTLSLSSAARLWHIGSSGAVATPRITVVNSGGFYQLAHHNGTTTSSATLGAAPSEGQQGEILAIVRGDGSVEIQQSIEGAAATTATDATTVDLEDDFAGTRRYLNSGGASFRGVTHLLEDKAIRGVKSMAEMRAL